MHRVAVLCGPGLGDSLVQMVVAHNLLRSGYEVTVFSNVIHALARWFPGYTIYAQLKPREMKLLSTYNKVFAPRPLPLCSYSFLASQWVNYTKLFVRNTTYAANAALVCKKLLNVMEATEETGILPPKDLQLRKHWRRVVIQPTSSEDFKNWPLEKFLRLADQLQHKGFLPNFALSLQEWEQWSLRINGHFPVRRFLSLDEFASFLFESGYMVANDSGGGHLSSSLRIPTLSLHGRSRKARAWRPAWGLVKVVTPTVNLVGIHLRRRFWRYFLSVNKVAQAFEELDRRASALSHEIRAVH